MADLRTLLESLGLENVRTYIQSGNAVFRTDAAPAQLAAKLEQAIEQKFGFDVPVIIRTRAEMERLLKQNPLLKEKGIDEDKLHITFLDEAPEASDLHKIETLDFAPDRFTATGREVYLYCPGGYGNTKLNNTFFERKLKRKATTRNLRTANELLRMAMDME